jgi:hypothetical protein
MGNSSLTNCRLLKNDRVAAVMLLCFVSCNRLLFPIEAFLSVLILRFFRAFSSVVRQMPGYNSQRRGTVRTLPIIFVLFYVLSVSIVLFYVLFVSIVLFYVLFVSIVLFYVLFVSILLFNVFFV